MDKVKIDNFTLANPNMHFPYWREISISESIKIKKTIISKLNLPSIITDLDLIKYIDMKGISKGLLDLDDYESIRRTLIHNLPPTDNPLVYINWYRMDKIDQMYLKEVITNFDDIWYPSADDIDIIDISISWIFSISHFGEIKLIELP
ncbi:hypothetical protein [Leptospira noguchii]|uniref:hypothetical protein n=1 Tax=Leptospira noguchii TaxID=28182 RepID=UPI001FB76699|nr:hypothetical protein [Leptospira noguchii]UOG32770.1 hypothetical protein MAL06_20710 [Leptospira noguchii]UOG36232.1 hypothetical protein MAL02_18760 [Leptospira noguchii]UOG47195.1 hypothetical protein MAL01_19160 [Leptospira noguchii]